MKFEIPSGILNYFYSFSFPRLGDNSSKPGARVVLAGGSLQKIILQKVSHPSESGLRGFWAVIKLHQKLFICSVQVDVQSSKRRQQN